MPQQTIRGTMKQWYNWVTSIPQQFQIAVVDRIEHYIFTTLTERAMKSDKGYAEGTLGLPFWGLHYRKFFVFVGKEFIKPVAEYGGHDVEDPRYDPDARKPFEPLKTLLQAEAIISLNGPEVGEERKTLKNFLGLDKQYRPRAYETAKEIIQDLKRDWHSYETINDAIFHACVRFVAKGLIGIPHIPADTIPLLREIDEAAFNVDKLTPDAFKDISNRAKQKNDELTRDSQNAQSMKGDFYLNYLLTHGRSKTGNVEGLNGFAGLIVVGNIAAILLAAVLKMGADKKIAAEFKFEFDRLKRFEDDPNFYEEYLQKNETLHKFYLEILRFYAPAAPVVRQTSKPATIGEVNVPARSLLFVPTRAIAHHPEHWKKPEVFDPNRFGKKRIKDIKSFEFPLPIFSGGNRNCPAASWYAEFMFKSLVHGIFKDRALDLAPGTVIEDIPVCTKDPKLKSPYRGALRERKRLKIEPIVTSYRTLQQSNHAAVNKKLERVSSHSESSDLSDAFSEDHKKRSSRTLRASYSCDSLS